MGDNQSFMNRYKRVRIDDFPRVTGADERLPFPECRADGSRKFLHRTLSRIFEKTNTALLAKNQMSENVLAYQLRTQDIIMRQDLTRLKKLRQEHQFSRHMLNWIQEQPIGVYERNSSDSSRPSVETCRYESSSMPRIAETDHAALDDNVFIDDGPLSNSLALRARLGSEARDAKSLSGRPNVGVLPKLGDRGSVRRAPLGSLREPVQSMAVDINDAPRGSSSMQYYGIQFKKELKAKQKPEPTFLERNFKPNSNRIFARYLKEKRNLEANLYSKTS